MSKMTAEELEQARKVADALNEEKTSMVHRLLAHNKALAAERDAERHTLEAESVDARSGRAAWRARAEVAESRLAAIRQRAGEARDLLGESSDNATKAWRLLELWCCGDDAPAVYTREEIQRAMDRAIVITPAQVRVFENLTDLRSKP
jgi:hypothetical protein